MTLKLDLPSKLEHKLHRQAQIAGVGESEFALRVIADRLTHGSAMLSEDEESLLWEIDRGFSDAWRDNQRIETKKYCRSKAPVNAADGLFLQEGIFHVEYFC